MATPAATPVPAPGAYTFSGSGDTTTDAFVLSSGVARFSLSFTPKKSAGSFWVYLVRVDGFQRIVAHEVVSEPYAGSKSVVVPPGRYFLNVEAEWRWQISVAG
ncbi:MAG: hypothetical protein FJ029_13925 [Actinobacteria bacterium]|nr:hypothetical protein [Actinomycetota bacterium]